MDGLDRPVEAQARARGASTTDAARDAAPTSGGLARRVARLRASARDTPLLGVLSNVGSRAYVGGINVLLTPFYVRLLGLESYGLIGVFSVITFVAFLLDLGLSATITRELSRACGSRETLDEAASVVRTYEIAYWAISICAGAALWALAPVLTRHWINASGLPPDQVTLALRLMGCTLAFAMPIGMYSGALIGLRRVDLLSGANALNATVKYLGALAALLVVSATPDTFFVWQAIAAAISVVVVRGCVGRALPAAAAKPRFDFAILRRSWRFTADMSGVSMVSIVTHNLDKIVLARVIPLGAFGIYSLAVTFSSVLLLLASAVYASTIARFTAAVETGARGALRKLFEQASDLLCVLVCPAGAAMIVLADRCMEVGTGDADITAQGAWVFCLTSLAALVNALSWPCYTLLIGAGRTRGVFKSYACGAVVLVPMIFLASVQFGMFGAAVMMVVYQVSNLVCMVWLARRHRLLEDTARWLLRHVVACNAVALLSALAVRAGVEPLHLGAHVDFRAAAVVELVLCYAVSLVCTGLFLRGRRAPVAAAG